MSDERIYQLLVDRFKNADRSNDNGDATGCPTEPIVGNDDVSDPRCARPHDKEAWHGEDFAGVKEKLDYIKGLGFTAIWLQGYRLQAVNSFVLQPCCGLNTQAGYHGYWPEVFPPKGGKVEPTRTDPHYGTVEELRDLIAAAHAKGLKVFADLVLNHTGYDSALVRERCDLFHPLLEITDATAFFTYLDLTGGDVPLAGILGSERGWLFGLPDLIVGHPEVRPMLNEHITFLRSVGFDGVRMDTASLTPGYKQIQWADYNGDPAAAMTVLRKEYMGEYLSVGGVGDPKYFVTIMEDAWDRFFEADASPTFRKYGNMNASNRVNPMGWYHFNDGFVPDVLSGCRGQTMATYAEFGNAPLPTFKGSRIDLLIEQLTLVPDPASRILGRIDSHDAGARHMSILMDECGYTRATAIERMDLALSTIYFAPGVPAIYMGTEVAAEGLNPFWVGDDARHLSEPYISQRADMDRPGLEAGDVGAGGKYKDAFALWVASLDNCPRPRTPPPPKRPPASSQTSFLILP